MITWLSGILRVKDEDGSRELPGFRCSSCNHFEESKQRLCPKCRGEYLGKIEGEQSDG